MHATWILTDKVLSFHFSYVLKVEAVHVTVILVDVLEDEPTFLEECIRAIFHNEGMRFTWFLTDEVFGFAAVVVFKFEPVHVPAIPVDVLQDVHAFTIIFMCRRSGEPMWIGNIFCVIVPTITAI